MQPIENNIYYPMGSHGLYAKIIRAMGLPVMIVVIVIIFTLLTGTSSAEKIEMMVPGFFHFAIFGGFVLAVVTGLLGALVGWLRYINTTFMVSDNALYLRNGILERTEISVPFRHMSNILQQQTILDRVLGICRCQIEIQAEEVSATTSATAVPDDVILYDVDMTLIESLRELLLSRANTQRMVMVPK
jgi:uncharacterized membrane protein YdbT with pleckstrin-like domain